MDKYLDFAIAALPFVIIGICIAVFCVKYKKGEDKSQNYMLEGMSIGMSLGITFSLTQDEHLAIGIGLGMLVGATIGMLIKKKPKE